MAATCEKCGAKTSNRKNRFCDPHAAQTLQTLEAAGYLEPLTVTTVDGVQKLSNRRFLTLPDVVGKRPTRHSQPS
jgi:hypothetical protein